jgi:hypothetical protein
VRARVAVEQRLGFAFGYVCGAATREQRVEIVRQQGGMRFAGGCEGRLDAEVQLLCTAFEPHPAARGERWRFSDLAQTEEAGIERARCVFAARGHRKLYVVEAEDFAHSTEC